MIEFALVLGVLLLLILGAIDGLQILMTNYTVSQAVRAAAHQAALIGGPDGSSGNIAKSGGTVAETARLVLDSGMATQADKAWITVACPTPCRRYSPITVTIQYHDDIWAPIGPFDTVQVQLSTTRAAEKDQQ
jgi:hypothetical protein